MRLLSQVDTILKLAEEAEEKESVMGSMVENISNIFIGLSILGAVVLLIGIFVFFYCKISKMNGIFCK